MAIQYTSRTYESILSDINSDNELVDKPNWFKRMIADLGDKISLWNNALSNNLLLSTAYTRRNVLELCKLIDYELTPHTTSSGTILFYFPDTVGFPFTIAITDLVALTAGTTSVSSKRFEARAAVNVTAVTEVFAPAAVNTGADTITVVRDFTTGEKVRFTTVTTLPAPLQLATDYWIIRVDATTIKVAESLAYAYAGAAINLTTQGVGNHTVHLFSVGATCYQQQTKETAIIGESDGTTEWQEFDLPDIDILEDALAITINSVSWTKVDTFVDSGVTDKHFRLFYNNDNSARIQFGNGTYGEIPGAFEIEADYAVGGGSDSNITVVNNINIYGGSDSNVNGVSNPSSLTGGDDAQDLEEAKILGPLLLKTRERFVTGDDGAALAIAYGGISQVKVRDNQFGLGSAQVLCIANGGGNLGAATKTALQNYLIDRTILESIDVRVQDVTITSTNVTSAAKMVSGYSWTDVQPWFRLGWKLFLSEAGKEIYDDYNANGVVSARTLINTIFSESYTSSDDTQIIQFLSNFIIGGNILYRLIGESIQESDAFTFLGFTTGVDYFTVTVPAFPVVLAEDEITTPGTLTLTEIP